MHPTFFHFRISESRTNLSGFTSQDEWITRCKIYNRYKNTPRTARSPRNVEPADRVLVNGIELLTVGSGKITFLLKKRRFSFMILPCRHSGLGAKRSR